VGYHHSAALNIPNNVTLIALPPCAPEIDPIQNVVSHRILDDDAPIVDACADAWNARVVLAERLRAITRRSWATAVKR
jgi:hypothetical protein